MTRTDLILASSSPYRRALLERLGLEFRVIAPEVDEAAVKDRGLPPGALAAALARRKADAVAARAPSSLVIGADQVCALGGEILDKPGGLEANVAQLQRLAGRTHELHTAVCIARGRDLRREFADVTRLTMRPLGRERLQRYVAMDRAADCAGGYKLESGGIALFESVVTADHTAILGLPLMRLVRELESLGIPLP